MERLGSWAKPVELRTLVNLRSLFWELLETGWKQVDKSESSVQILEDNSIKNFEYKRILSKGAELDQNFTWIGGNIPNGTQTWGYGGANVWRNGRLRPRALGLIMGFQRMFEAKSSLLLRVSPFQFWLKMDEWDLWKRFSKKCPNEVWNFIK